MSAEAPASADCAEGSPAGSLEPDRAGAETRVADSSIPGTGRGDSAPDEAEDDAAVEEALRFALGRAWRLNALCVWTHADLLDHGLDDFLDGLEDGLRDELDAFAGGPALLDNLGSGAREDALVADLVERARRFAGPRSARRRRRCTARSCSLGRAWSGG